MDVPKSTDFRVPEVIATDGVQGRQTSATPLSTSLEADRIPLAILVIGMGLPTLVTWIYFDALAHSDRMLQQGAYVVGKGAQFLLPLFAWWRWRTGWNRGLPSRAESESGPAWLRPMGTAAGGIFLGIAIAILMFLLYFFWLEPQGVMATAKLAGEEKLRALGIDSVWLLFTLALFYAVLHSGFEEFYWRRFVFCGLTTYCSWWGALIASSLAFMAHHIIVLSRFFGWLSPWTYFFAMGVAVGGGLWGAMLWRSRKWTSAWISHGIVDAAIFLIALRLLYGS